MPIYSTKEQLDQFYMEVMKAESIGMGAALDRNMYNKNIAIVFRKKFGMSFHSSMVLLYAGKMPGHERMLSIDIAEMINNIEHVSVCSEYFSSSVAPGVRSKYNLSHWPSFKRVGRPNRNKSRAPYRRIKIAMEECVECGKEFLEREDGTHCFCLQCCPGWVMYGDHSNANQQSVF